MSTKQRNEMRNHESSFAQSSAIYADEKDVFGILMEAMQELVKTRPAEPIPALLRFFLRKSRPIVRVAVTGPPYSGRHALSRKIAEVFDLPLIELGTLLEKTDPQLRTLVQSYRNRRQPLPPELAFSLLQQKIFNQECVEKGWVLCGFPESRAQDALFRRRAICAQKTIILNVSSETVAKRSQDSYCDCIAKRINDVNENKSSDAKELILKRFTEESFDVVENAAQTIRKFAYESLIIRKNTENLSKEDVSCIVLNGDRSTEQIFSEVVNFVSTKTIQNRPNMHRLIFLGRRGSGKKTMANNLEKHFGLFQISSENLLMRAGNDPENDYFRETNLLFSKNQSVSDDLVGEMVLEQLRNSELNGFVLRGFPRSPTQAEFLNQFGFRPSKVFFFNISEEMAAKRILLRRRNLEEKVENLTETNETVTSPSSTPTLPTAAVTFPPSAATLPLSPATSPSSATFPLSTTTSPSPLNFICSTTRSGLQEEALQFSETQEENEIFSENEAKLKEFYKDILFEIDANLPEKDVFGQIKHHLLHPHPLRAVKKVLLMDEDPTASVTFKKAEVNVDLEK